MCVSVWEMLQHRAYEVSDWQRGADIYMLRTDEFNLCVGNGLIQLA